jgi:hypothetical protein
MIFIYGFNERDIDQLSICETGLLYRSNVLAEIEQELTKSDWEGTKNYFAYKSLSEVGLKFFLLTQNDHETRALIYSAPGKLETRVFAQSEGEAIFGSLFENSLSELRNVEGPSQNHGSCHYVKVRIDERVKFVSITNPSANDLTGELSIELVAKMQDHLNKYYSLAEETPSITAPPEPMSLTEVESMKEKQNNNIFNELRTL